MNSVENYFTYEQVTLLKASAKKLRMALRNSNDPIADDLLQGELGKVINNVLESDRIAPFEFIPYFEKMTKGFMPSIEDEYLEFYSLAKYGVPAFEIK